VLLKTRGKNLTSAMGPFTAEQLQALAKRGQFSRTHEISTDSVTWSRAANRLDLFPAVQVEPRPLATPPTEDPPILDASPATAAPPPSDIWYYHQLGANHGPVDFTHLQYLAVSGQILPDDLVWKEGLPEWIAAGRVPGLIKANPGLSAIPTAPVYVGVSPVQSGDFPRVSGLAVASLVLGLLGWLCGIPGILAIIFGAVALRQIQEGKGRVTGTGMAIAGLVLGIVFLTLYVIYAIALIFALSSVPFTGTP
jgi:hypothetical protein